MEVNYAQGHALRAPSQKTKNATKNNTNHSTWTKKETSKLWLSLRHIVIDIAIEIYVFLLYEKDKENTVTLISPLPFRKSTLQ